MVATLSSFMLLNRAVVEPRLHLVLFSVARPGLLAVLLLNAFATAAAARLVRSALHAMGHRLDTRTPPAPPEVPTADPPLPAIAVDS